MKPKRSSFGLALVAAAALTLVAGSAKAASMVAGWDFSQFFGSTALSTDGATAATSIDANYSDFDPNFAGSESAAFGGMFYDGSFGSTNIVPDFSGNEPFIPLTGSLSSNQGAPGPFDGTLPFGSGGAFGVLSAEGQQFTENLSMRANSEADIVFQADLSSLSATGSNWELGFGGITEAGTANVEVGVSTDGATYSVVETLTLNTLDTLYTASLGAAVDGASQVFVRLGFGPQAPNLPIIDNVSISADVGTVPEPGVALLGLAGLAGLGLFGRRRA